MPDQQWHKLGTHNPIKQVTQQLDACDYMLTHKTLLEK